MLLKAVPNHVTPINDGLRTIQFQSLSADPTDPSARIFGGTQDNGTWSYDTSRSEANRWFESVGGDGGQSGFDPTGGPIRYHNYYDATPEVNFHGGRSEDLAGDLRPAAAERGERGRSTRRSRSIRRRPGACSRAWATSGGPMTTAGTSRR